MQDRERREEKFWDEHVPTLDESLREHAAGPDPNSALLLDALEPLEERHVLDFACGTGVVTAWLAERGAHVTGLDISSRSVERARELCEAVGTRATFVTGELGEVDLGRQTFDRIAGRFALHHVDCARMAPVLAGYLRPGGAAAFLETMDSNPLLRVARWGLVGRLGIPRYGSEDESPLTERDLEHIRAAFGSLSIEVAQMRFLRILDRNVLGYRRPALSRLLAAADDLLLKCTRWRSGSYHQVLVCVRPYAALPGERGRSRSGAEGDRDTNQNSVIW